MANWRSMILTYKGIALQTKVEAGKTTIHFTKMKSGVGSIDSSKELARYTDLVDVRQELEITNVEIQVSESTGLSNVCKVTSILYNNSLETGEEYYLRELGLYAQDPDEGEILYAITVDDAPDFIPSALSGATTIMQEFNVYVAVGSSSEVTFDGATGGLASTGFVRSYVVTIAPNGEDISYGHKVELTDNNNGSFYYKHQNGLYDKVNLSTTIQQVKGGISSVNGFTPNSKQEVVFDTIKKAKILVNDIGNSLNIGDSTLPIYFKDGVPTSVGDTLNVNISGNAKSAEKLKNVNNLGGENMYTYFKNGNVVTPSSTIGGNTQFMYQASGRLVASTASVGNSLTPIFMDRGILKPISKSLIDLIYPIGSIYISMNSTSPSNFFGGEWVQLKDRFLLSAGNKFNGVGNPVGGEEVHTLSLDEIPSHNHSGSTGKSGEHNHTRGTMEITGAIKLWKYYDASGAFVIDGSWGESQSKNGGGDSTAKADFKASRTWSGETSKAANHSHTISSEGNGKSHNNMPPYITVYMWYRTK